MTELSDLCSLLADEHGLAVVSTTQRAGGILSSVVNAGVMPHPVTGADTVVFVSGGSAARLDHVRRGSEVGITVRRGWRWAGASGSADVIGPDDPVDGFDADRIRVLLREVFVAAGGTHDDFEEYDRAMLEDRRAAVFVDPARILGNG